MTRLTILIAVFSLVFAMPALAQVSRGGGSSDQMARVQAMLAQERAKTAEALAAKRRVEEDLKKADSKIASLEAKLAASKRAKSGLQTRLDQSMNNAQSQTAALDASRNRFQELLSKSREIASNLRDSERRATELTRDLAMRDGDLANCTAKNAELLDINGEMVAFLRGEGGALDALLRREPFTGIKRVRRENKADDFAYRAQDSAVVTARDGGG